MRTKMILYACRHFKGYNYTYKSKKWYIFVDPSLSIIVSRSVYVNTLRYLLVHFVELYKREVIILFYDNFIK